MKKKVIIFITLAIMLSACKKEEQKLPDGCAIIQEIIPPNTFYFHNPKTNKKQMAQMGTVDLATYKVGDMICRSTIFSF